MPEPIYDESTIKSLDWKEHIRTRPGILASWRDVEKEES